MKKIVFHLLLFWFVFAFVPAQAQTVKQFLSADGLGNDHIKGLVYDRYGYLWIGTESGLKRFDGAEFRTFNPSNFSDIFNTENRIVCMLPNPDGSVVGIVVDGTVFRAVGDTLTPYQLPKSFFGSIGACAANQNPEVLHHLGYKRRSYGSAYVELSESKKLIMYSQNCTPVQTLPFPCPQKQFMFTRLFNIGNKQLFYLDDHLNFHEFNGQQWVLSSQSTFATPPNEPFSINLLKSPFDSSGFLIIQSDIYRFEYDPASHQIKTGPKLVTIPGIQAFRIALSEKTQTLSVGSISDGLYIVYDVFKENKSKIIRTTSEVGLKFINKSTLLTSNYKVIENDKVIGNYSPMKYQNISSVFMKDRFGYTWTYINNESPALVRINPNDIHQIEIFKIPYDDHPKCMYEDNNGHIWLFLPNMGTAVFKNTKEAAPKEVAFVKGLTYVKGVIAEGNTLLAFSDMSKVFRINLNDFSYSESPISNLKGKIRSVFKLGKDTFLYTTYGDGLRALVNGQSFRIPNDPFNALQHSHCINETGDQQLIIPTNSGLVILGRSDLIGYIRHRGHLFYKVIQKFDGFKNEFNGECMPCSELEGGFIYYPHIEGIAKIDLKACTEDRETILHHSLDSFGFGLSGFQPFKTGQKNIEMPANSNILRLKNSLVYWGDRSNISIRVIVNNGNFHLDTVFRNKVVVLQDLPSGLNRIEIEYYHSGTQGGRDLIHVRVRDKFYETILFWVLLIIGFVALTLFSIYIYGRYLVARNLILKNRISEATAELRILLEKISKDKESIERSVAFKNRIISVITHDILGPLAFSRKVIKSISGKTEDAMEKRQLEEIQKSNEKIVSQAHEILTWSKVQNAAIKPQLTQFKLSDLCKEIININQPIARSKNIKIRISFPEGIMIFSDRNILSITISNLIENAIKYGTREVVLDYVRSGNNQTISVSNPGNPFNPQFVASFNNDDLEKAVDHVNNPGMGGYGLRICKEILKVIRGDIKIVVSEKGENRVVVSLPEEIPEH